MLLIPLKHFYWQVLRVLVRAESAGEEYPTGRELRLIPTRTTKDGTFLDEMVEAGLIAVATSPTKTASGEKGPPQFRTHYKLTEKGRHAAEYGEYEQAYTPADRPLTGLAAETIGPLIEKAARWVKPPNAAAADGSEVPTAHKKRRKK